jgi:hypothetical protein
LNEYTRREEIRWTLATVFILVPCVAIAMVRLMLAQGPMVTNPTAIKAESDAKQAQQTFAPCTLSAKTLVNEVDLFRTHVKGLEDKAKKDAEAERDKDPKLKDQPLSVVIPWGQAWGKPSDRLLKLSKSLQQDGCRAATEKAAGKNADASKAWDAVAKAADIKDPGASAPDQEAAAKKLHELFKDAGLDKVKGHVTSAADSLDASLKEASSKRETELVRAPLPQGLFPPGAAIGVGVGVSLAALIISYFSVRSASTRRGRTLVALRRFANTPEAGLQAAAIVRLAAHHTGGEPGMVIGAAVGGLTAAVLSPTDNPNIFIADLFVAGSMGGLLIGLAAQWLVRTLTGVTRWRERTKELGDIEKPTIPVALVLGGVTPGLEKQFLRYFEALPVADAATVVQKLAAQAEEQILAAADAAAQQQMYGAQPAGNWGQPM